jgi:general secretion pathway protein B
MSLILEALKKSEAERQRVAGPTLLEVRVVRPQRRYPLWALAVGVLLGVNMVLLLVFVLHRPAAAPVTAVAPPNPGMFPAMTPGTATALSPSTLPRMPYTGTTKVAASGAEAPPAMAAAAAAGHVPGTPPTLADEPPDDSANPADEVPAVTAGPGEAPATGGLPAAGSVKIQRDDAGGYASLPSFSELTGNLPPLRLDLHVYAERPRDRYALINMQRVHEGDTLSEGVRVLAITREGVALDYRGQQFMLRPQQ